MFAAQTVDLFNPELGAKTVDLIPGEDDTNTVDLLTPSEEDSTKTVDLLNPEQPSATIEQQKPIIEKNENKTVDTITPRGDDIVPAEGKKSTTTIVVGGDEIEEGETNENSEISPEEIILPEENEKEEKKDASFEDEEHHENAGVLPWSTDLVKPWSIYRAPKTVYRPGEDLDLTELLVEIKTGRSGSLYNIEDLINDEFTTITRTRKSDGQKVRLDDKIYEDETMTIHMDGCQDLTIDFTVDENLKDEAKAFEAFQQNLIREEFRNGLDFSLYLIKKGEKENPVVAYSLDSRKLTPIGNGVDKKLKDGPLFDLKDINSWDRYDIETIGKVKAILERSAELKNTENIRKKLITQLAIWNVTSNIIPEEIDATVSEPTEVAPELKPADETKENPEEDKKDEPIEITEPTTPEEETENIEKENEKVKDTKDETVEIKTEEKVEEKAETEENKESEKIEEKAPVQSTVHKIVFNAKEIDVPYDDIELSDEEYELYKELTSLEAVELKNEDEDLKIYEPIVIEETENQYADLVTIGESDIDSIERVATEVTFDAVEYSFQNLYHTLETSSMLGFGQPRDFNVLLKATMKASRKIVEGDKFEVEILSKTLPILNGEEGRANDIQIDGKVVATAEYIAEEHKIVYTFVEDLDTDKVEIEQEFKQIKEEKAALLNMLEVSENLVLDAVRGAEGDENSEENPDELEISPEFEENLIELKLGNTKVTYTGASFETKKFRLKTTMTAKAAPVWKIPKDWTFDVNIGPYLKPEYDENSEPILKPLYDPNNPGKVIATPSYIENEDGHIIRYTFNNNLTETKKLDIDQLLAFDTEAIGEKREIDIDIVVFPKNNNEQRMPTIKVKRTDPRTEIPSLFPIDVNENGEPNLNDGHEFFEYGPSYKVTFDASANPIVENREVKAVEWTVIFNGNGENLNSDQLDLITNFTAVKNSGISEIQNVRLNDKEIELTNNTRMENAFLINDSKYFDGHKNSESVYTFKFITPVDSKQKAYVLDIAAKLRGVKKTGAVRLIMPAYEGAKLEMVSPNDMTYSNRATVSGKFTSENTAEWIVTEEVSSGDPGMLPLTTRKFSDNQNITSLEVAYYSLNDEGIMYQVSEPTLREKMPMEKGKLTAKPLPAGSIAVYKYETKFKETATTTERFPKYTLSDASISQYRDVDLNVSWAKHLDNVKYPEHTIILLDDKNTEINQEKIDRLTEEELKSYPHVTIEKEKDYKKDPEINTKIPNVKLWNVDENGNYTSIDYKIFVKMPKEGTSENGTSVKYGEVYKNYEPIKNRYVVKNYITPNSQHKTSDITIIKKDEENTEENTKGLSGARFKLFGTLYTDNSAKSTTISFEDVTDENGEIKFTDVPAGNYTLQEIKAPNGYEINNDVDSVVVKPDGTVEWSHNLIWEAKFDQGASAENWKSEVAYNAGEPKYPGYMNSLNYTEVDKNNKVISYILLKPKKNEENKPDGTLSYTDRDTRLSIFGDNISISSIELYDVNPDDRASVVAQMNSKNVSHKGNGNIGNILVDITTDKKHYNKNYDITLDKKFSEPFLNNKEVNAISIPYVRFGDSSPGWAFLVKVTGSIDDSSSDKPSTLSYNWLSVSQAGKHEALKPSEIAAEAKILSDTEIPGKNKRNGVTNPVFTVKNKLQSTTDINIQKLDSDNNKLAGAEFSLYDSKDSLLNKDITTKDGRLTFRNIAPGQYKLRETKSPSGYYNPGLEFTVTVNPDGSIIYDAVNSKKEKVEQGEYYRVGESFSGGSSNQTIEKKITVLDAKMYLDESSHYGKRKDVWEEAAYESYNFEARFKLQGCKAGDSWTMDFDDNWNFTQWSAALPVIKSENNETIATGKIDYTNNKITYTLENPAYVNTHSEISAEIKLNSIRPSKYFVKNNGIYSFTDVINVGPNEKVIETRVNADLGEFYGQTGDRIPKYTTQNVDIYKDGNENKYMMRNIALFNATGRRNLVGDSTARIYYGSSKNSGSQFKYGDKQKPTFKPVKVIVYKVKHPNSDNMPLSCGINPSLSDDYEKLAEFTGFGDSPISKTDGGVNMNYNPKRVDLNDKYHPDLYDTYHYQFWIRFPNNSPNGEGYVVEQYYSIEEEKRFNDTYTQTFMAHSAGNYSSIGFEQIKPTLNAAAGIGSNIIIPPKKNYDLTVFNNKNPGQFIIKKISMEKDSNQNDIPLSGAEFALMDSNGNVIKRESSNKDGIVQFNGLNKGEYTLKETVPPKGYDSYTDTIKIVVDEHGDITFSNADKNKQRDNNIIEIQKGTDTTEEIRVLNPTPIEKYPSIGYHGYKDFMNVKTKFVSADETTVKSRIFLNPSNEVENGKELGNGPDQPTIFSLLKNAADSVDYKIYKIPKNEKPFIYENTPISDSLLFQSGTIGPKVDSVNINFSKDDKGNIISKANRWQGAAYIVDITAKYKGISEKEENRSVYFDWKYINDQHQRESHMEGTVGAKVKYVTKTINHKTTPVLKFKNKKSKGEIIITKIDDETKKVLEGAEFEILYKEKENEKPVMRKGQPYIAKTDSKGKAIFGDLEFGTYIIREKTAPDGYILSDKEWTVVVGEDNNVENSKNITTINTGNDEPLAKITTKLYDNKDTTYNLDLNLEPLYPSDNSKKITLNFDFENFDVFVNDKLVDDNSKADFINRIINFNKFGEDLKLSLKIKPKNSIQPGKYKPIKSITIDGKDIELSAQDITFTNDADKVNLSNGKYRIFDSNDYYQRTAIYTNSKIENQMNGWYKLTVCLEPQFYTNKNYPVYLALNTNEFEVKYVSVLENLSYKDGVVSGYKNVIKGDPQYLVFNVRPKNRTNNILQPIKEYYLGGAKIPEIDYYGRYLSNINLGSDVYLKAEPIPEIKDNGDVIKDGNEYLISIDNKQKSYDVEFNKVDINKNPLSRAVFEVQKKYTVEGKDTYYYDFLTLEERKEAKTTATSDESGKIIFNGLKPGEYRIIEVKAPEGYNIPKGAVKYFKIENDGTVKILVDKSYVDKNAENSTIVNSNLGEFKIVKIDGSKKDKENNPIPLEGVKFKLLDSNKKQIEYSEAEKLFTTDSNGEILFKDLKPGKYYVKEVQTLKGYVLDETERPIIIGKEWNIPNKTEGTKDVSNALKLDNSKSNMTSYKKEEYVDPNKSDVLVAHLKYDIDKETEIKSGDTFILTASENIDLDGIGSVLDETYDIYGPLGLLAKAKIQDNRRSIKYTFTEYADYYKITELNIGMDLAIDRFEVPGDENGEQDITVDISPLNSSEIFSKPVKVKYFHAGIEFFGEGCLVKYDDSNQGFKAYVYINNRSINKIESIYKTISINPLVDLNINTINLYKVTNGMLPWSYGIDTTKSNSYGLVNLNLRAQQSGGSYYLYPNYYNWDDNTYLLEISGQVTDKSDSQKILNVIYTNNFKNSNNQNEYYELGIVLRRAAKTTVSHGTGEIKIQIENHKNEILFEKVDGRDNNVKLQGAQFTLYKAKEKNGQYEKINNAIKFGMVDNKSEFVPDVDSKGNPIPEDPSKGNTVTSDKNGLFKYEALKDGIYAVKETKAPEGYTKLLDYVFYFKVEGGKIYRVNKLGQYIDSKKKVVKDEAKDTSSLIVDMEKDKPQSEPIQIENFKAEYPATGGVGALPFVFIGMMIMMVGAYMFIRRRDALYE